MILFRKAIFSFVLLTGCISYSQETLKGTVYSAKDSTTVLGASVYFDGTNIGVSTGSDGGFQIINSGNITSPLIISSLGFKTYVVTETNSYPEATLKIFLRESTESLDEVMIETDPWTRKTKLRIFRREFLGNTPDATHSKIKNEDAVKLRYIPSKNVLLAHAEEPLLIKNRHLGYELRYNLENFKVEFSIGTSGLKLVNLVYYEGYIFFNELSKSPSKKHLKNREKIYKGSSLHFMRSLASKKLHENGFRIFHEKFEVPPYQLFLIENSDDLTRIKLLEERITILYEDFNQSYIIAKDIFFIDQYGNHTPPTNIIFGGDMGKMRIARTLPTNYNFFSEADQN